jgi:hypothetical protein
MIFQHFHAFCIFTKFYTLTLENEAFNIGRADSNYEFIIIEQIGLQKNLYKKGIYFI